LSIKEEGNMFKNSHAFSGFSVDNLEAAEKFYRETLGLDVEKNQMGLQLKIASGNSIFLYQKDNHQPATYTVLNFPVDDIDKAVEELVKKGITLERYDNIGFEQDGKGIVRGKAAGMGPDIAWFTDPAGNVLAVLQD
jgi:predicted enzyme related to lactoylglutathione lyase